MTRIAFVTDQHYDVHSRFEETVRIHKWIAADAAARGCTLTLLGGDMFERKSVPEERNAAGDWLLSMAELGPVVGVYGNHEIAGDLDLYNLLEAPHPVHFFDRPAVIVQSGVAIACLPWPRKANLLAAFGEDRGKEELGNLAQEHLRAVLRGLGSELEAHRGKAPRIALAHVMIDGAKTDHDQPIVGADMALSLLDLSLLDVDFYACGHVHAQQEETIHGAPCIYGGAPRHNNFGEPGAKGYVVVEFKGGKLVSWERVATPATPMILLEAVFADGVLELSDRQREIVDESPAAEIRVRYQVDSDQREPARAKARELAAWLVEQRGAISVKTEEEVRTTKRARAPEVARALTVADKLTAHWQSTGFSPGEREPALKAKATQLEEEDRNAA